MAEYFLEKNYSKFMAMLNEKYLYIAMHWGFRGVFYIKNDFEKPLQDKKTWFHAIGHSDNLMKWTVFVVWLTEERRLSWFPVWTIVRDPTISSLWHDATRIGTRVQKLTSETDFRRCWMKLCSGNNYDTMVPINWVNYTFLKLLEVKARGRKRKAYHLL